MTITKQYCHASLCIVFYRWGENVWEPKGTSVTTRDLPQLLYRGKSRVWRAIETWKGNNVHFYETWKGKKLDAFKTLPTYSHCSLSAGTLRTNGKVRIFYQAFNILLLRSRFRSAGSVSLYISMGVVCQKSVNFLTLTVTEWLWRLVDLLLTGSCVG